VGYNLRSQQKAQLIDIIHKQFPGHPRALAIGDAYNDMIMFAAADISIQMQSALQGFNEHKDRLD
jgi:cation transport ATPase